jgi:hypothetical protein
VGGGGLSEGMMVVELFEMGVTGFVCWWLSGLKKDRLRVMLLNIPKKGRFRGRAASTGSGDKST